MFIRKHVFKKAGATQTYLRVVESRRIKGKVVQETLVNFGNISHWPKQRVKELIQKLSRFIELETPGSLEDMELKGVLNFGQAFALGLLWDSLQMTQAMERVLATPSFVAPIKAMVFNRLIQPHSELSTCQWVRGEHIEGIPEDIPLHHYYRALSQMIEVKEPLESALYNRLNTLFSLDFSMVFYDLSSSYFEGAGPSEAKRGYSRDHRPDRPQVEIGLVVNHDGLPITHMVFEGNLKDSRSLPEILERMQGAFKIRRCIFVCDKGMVSRKNLKDLSSSGYEYIVSIKLRHSQEASSILPMLPERERFVRLKDNLLVFELPAKAQERYIACYNPLRARESAEHREANLRECEQFLQQFHLPPKQGKTKDPLKIRLRIDRYLRRKKMSSFFHYGFDPRGELTYSRRQEEIEREACLDGLFIIKTNSPKLSAQSLALGYKSLWEVENAFREIKDFLKVRPIYHHNGQRVKGHIFVCFLAYLLEKLMEKRLEEAGLFISARKALQSLSPIKVVISELAGQRINKVTTISKEQEEILKALGAQKMPKIVS